jgi:hypothetical protein
MIVAAGAALELALACHRSPARLPAVRARRLPPDLLGLLRVAAGDEAERQSLAAASGEPPELVAEAAVFFIQQVLFAPDADSYRVLGVAPDAPDARIREHYRWLVRWQHPDRRGDAWDAVYADRINRAWQDLRLPERRAAYDRSGPGRAAAALPPDDGAPSAPRLARDAGAPLVVSGRLARRLPQVVLGALSVVAALLLAVMWAGRPDRVDEGTAAAAAPSDPDAEAAAALARLEARLAASLAPEPASGGAASPSVPTPPAAEPVAGCVSFRTAAVAVVDRTAAVETPPGVAPAAAAFVVPSAAAATVPDAAVPADDPAPRVAAAPAPPPAAPVDATPPPRPPDATPPVVAARPAMPENSAPDAAAAATAMPAPAMPPAAAAVAEPTGSPPTEAEAIALVRRFATAYEAGDLAGLMRLFTSDARNNRGSLAAIFEDYDALFARTQARSLDLQVVGWIDRGTHGTLLARYTASVTPVGERRRADTGGDILFDVRRDVGVARISGITHDVP